MHVNVKELKWDRAVVTCLKRFSAFQRCMSVLSIEILLLFSSALFSKKYTRLMCSISIL